MNTFLPFPSYSCSASVLDRKRLCKQRVEAWQILNALKGESSGWRNHPATRMWRGCEYQLCLYGMAICGEWRARGYKDSMWDRFFVTTAFYRNRTELPVWFGDSDFHKAHQSNLIRKLPAHYRSLFPGVPDDLPYVWPA
jgi:hypothetical protein